MQHIKPPSADFRITIEPEAYDIYMHSIARRPPEEYAILAGSLDDPFHITDLRPMPPMPDARGRPNAGHAHVQLNADYVGHYLNRELVPFGKYLLGILHTHPLGISRLSNGRAGSGDGDIPSMRGTLERAATIEPRWQNFLAPIGMYDPEKGEDHLIGYIIRCDHADPIPAPIEIVSKREKLAPAAAKPGFAEPSFPIDDLIARGWRYQEKINAVLADQASPRQHREWMADYLNDLRQQDLLEQRSRLGALIDRCA